MFDLRMAHLRPPAAPRPAVLRPQSGRPPDDARDVGRRRAERSVHVGRGDRVRRPVHARRHHGRDAVDELAAGAGRLFGAAADRARHAVVPPQRARLLPGRPRLDRAHQRVPAGKHHRDVDGAAVPAGSAELRPVRRDRSQAPRRQHRFDFLLLGVLSGDRSGQLRWRRR